MKSSDTTATRTPSRGVLALLIAGLFFVAAIANLNLYGWWDRPLLIDNQHYFYIAERAAEGVPPHVSQVDPKNMLAPMISAVAIRAGRTVGLDDVRAARIPSLAVTALSVALAWLLAWQLSGSALAGHLAALAMLATWGLFHEAVIGVRPKVFMVFFQLAAHLAVTRRRHATAGAAAAGAFLCWQPAGVVLAAVGIAALATKDRARAVARTVAGALLPLALYEFYFVWHGVLAIQLEQAYLLPLSTGGISRGFAATIDSVLRYGRPEASWVALMPIATALAMAGLWWAAATEPRRTLARAAESPGWVASWIALHGALAFTFTDYQAYPDLLILQPYFAVIGACALSGTITALRTTDLSRYAAAAPIAIALALTFSAWSVSTRDRTDPATIEDQYALGELVGLYLEEFDGVWAVGCTHLLGFNHADNHSPYAFFFDDIRNTVGKDPEWRPLRDGREPELILNSRGLPRTLNPMLEKYVDDTPPMFANAGIRVLRRRTGIEAQTVAKQAAQARDGAGDRPVKKPAHKPQVATATKQPAAR